MTPPQATEKPSTVKKVLAIVKKALAIVGVLLLWAFIIVQFSRMSWGELGGCLIFFVVIIALVALAIKFPLVDRLLPYLFGAPIWFGLWMFITAAPILIFAKVSEVVIFGRSVLFQTIALSAWGCFLIFALALIATKKNRERLFVWMRSAGRLAPLIYSFDVLMIALIFFASVTHVFADHGLINLQVRVGGTELALRDRLLAFYGWHFLEGVPLLKINQTMGWDQAPLTYHSEAVGLMLLLFKLTVIVPVIAAFVGYWKFEDKPLDLEDYRLARRKGNCDGLRVKFFGVSSLLFSDGETAFMIDGFFTRPGKFRTLFRKIEPDVDLIKSYLERANIKELAAVIVAHSHYDHALDAPVVANLTGAVLLGSKSTARIGAAFGVDQIREISDGHVELLGEFQITFVQSHHCPIGILKRFGIEHVLCDGEVSDQFKSPARWWNYKEGGSYSVLIEHRGRKLLVQSSAGFLPRKLEAYDAEVVFLGIGTLGNQTEDYRNQYWRHIVEAVGARRVIPVHWDDFSKSLDKPLVPTSLIVDNVERSIAFLSARGEREGVDVKILPTCEDRDLPTWEERDPFAGLEDARA